MFVDFRDRGHAEHFDTDVCIIGAGAAGIALAREFIGNHRTVCLVESGGLEFDPDVHQLYDAESSGYPYHAEAGRLRYFGGTTNHWTGRCVPLDALDFEPRPWISDSGWPFARGELTPYYHRAYEVCGLQPRVAEESLWQRLRLNRPRLLASRLCHLWWQWSAPLRLGAAYRRVDRTRASHVNGIGAPGSVTHNEGQCLYPVLLVCA